LENGTQGNWRSLMGMRDDDPSVVLKQTDPIQSRDVLPLLPSFPGGVDRTAIESAIRKWIDCDLLTSLLVSFGGPVPNGRDLTQDLRQLEEFSNNWDFRGGVERNLARSAKLTMDQQEIVSAAAHALGLRGAFQRPQGDHYAHCLILGGMVRACMVRPLWAAELMKSGITFGEITALAAFRNLGGDEPDLASLAGLSAANDEMGAMDAGVRRAFSLNHEPIIETDSVHDHSNGNWMIRRYFVEKGIPVSVIAAPSSEPSARRANTADTYEWWAKRVANLKTTDRVLLITSPIYVPFQHADAIRMLGLKYSCGIDTVGVPMDISAGLPPQPFTHQHYLQELRSTIRSFRLLMEEL
jgi:hypothetical protein